MVRRLLALLICAMPALPSIGQAISEQRRLLLLERQQSAMKVIAALAVHGDDPVTRAAAESATHKAQIAYLV